VVTLQCWLRLSCMFALSHHHHAAINHSSVCLSLQFDMTWIVVSTLQRLGLATNVKLP
jgi:fatty-acid desaturase